MTTTLNDVHRLVMDAILIAQTLGACNIVHTNKRGTVDVRAETERVCTKLNDALNAVGSIQLAQMSTAQAVLTLASGRGKVAQALAAEHAVTVHEDDDGSSTLYEFPDGSRLRVRLSAHVVERAETW